MLSPPLVRAALAAGLVVAVGCNESALPPLNGPARPAVAVAQPTPAATTAPAPAPAGPATVARIGGLSVSRTELDELLYKSYGINLLARLVELDMARQALAKKGLSVTDADVAAERRRSMEGMFPADKDKPENFDQDFAQLKAREHLTDTEFDLLVHTNATLRKLAHPQVGPQVSEASVHQAFELLYGANRVISDITVQNMVEAAEVHRRLAAGEAWATVVPEMSIDPQTRESGGRWPPFSAKTPGVPPALMEAAFSLSVGQVSAEPIVEGPRYHVIKLLAVIPPKLVDYDQVKADVRRQVEDQLEQQFVNQFREQIKQATVAGLQIDDPTLKGAWDAMIAAQQPKGATLSPGDTVKKIHGAEGPPAPATRPTP